MRRIVHLSDFHFGWNEEALSASLCAIVSDLKPDLTVLSGDFAEHATRAEFQLAHDFVKGLPQPTLSVPGNHDLPFYNFPKRLTQGLRLYREFITSDLHPFFQDEELAVVGVNSARLWPIRGGSISRGQVEEIAACLCDVPNEVTRVLVTHHPFNLPATFTGRHLIKNGRKALGKLACCLDLVLAGHMHVGGSGRIAERFQTKNGDLVFVQAGTAISKRYKGEQNSFNIIEAEGRKLHVVKYTWDADQSAYSARPGEALDYVPTV